MKKKYILSYHTNKHEYFVLYYTGSEGNLIRSMLPIFDVHWKEVLWDAPVQYKIMFIL